MSNNIPTLNIPRLEGEGFKSSSARSRPNRPFLPLDGGPNHRPFLPLDGGPNRPFLPIDGEPNRPFLPLDGGGLRWG